MSHLDPRDTWDKASGRLWRIKASGAQSVKPFDVTKLKNAELIQLLSHPNKWWRQMALRVFHDRNDRSVVPELAQMITKETGQLALEAFWALNASGGFNDALALKTLQHSNKMVRYWTVRLLGDKLQVVWLYSKVQNTLKNRSTDVESSWAVSLVCHRPRC